MSRGGSYPSLFGVSPVLNRGFRPRMIGSLSARLVFPGRTLGCTALVCWAERHGRYLNDDTAAS